jgi:sialate O-acetylesterase
MASTKLSGIYSNGLVLQRNKEIIISGQDDRASGVVVTLAGCSVAAEVTDGIFKAVFPPMDAVFDTELKVEGTEVITIKDVCIGDVFMLAGQSNMELPVIRTIDLNREEIEAGDYPFVRQYRLTPDLEIPVKGEESICVLPENDWVKASGSGKYEISAIGFYAAKRIFEEKNIPIGLILNAQGGANIESWMCEEDLFGTGTKEEDIAPFRGKGVLKAYVDEGNQKVIHWRENTVDKDFSIEDALADSVNVKMPCIVVDDFCGSLWFAKDFELDKKIEGECLLRLGDLIDADVTYVNGVEVGRTEYQYPPRKYTFDGSILKEGKNTIRTRLIIEQGAGGFVPGHPYFLETPSGKIDLTGTWKMAVEKKTEKFIPNKMAQNIPSSLYYASLITLKGINISGIWWCQGESNAEFPEGYDKKMILMFKKMRGIMGDVPIVLVKIADYINPLTDTKVPEGWRQIQKMQDEAPGYISNLKVVKSPCPDPVFELHPQNKSSIGADVAKAAMEF